MFSTYAELDALELPFAEGLDIDSVVKDVSFPISSHFSFFIFTNIWQFQQKDVYIRPSWKSLDPFHNTIQQHPEECTFVWRKALQHLSFDTQNEFSKYTIEDINQHAFESKFFQAIHINFL